MAIWWLIPHFQTRPDGPWIKPTGLWQVLVNGSMFSGSLWPHQLLATQRVQFDPQTTKHCYFALLQVAKRMSIEFVLFMSNVSIYFHLKSMANHLRQHPRHALASGDKTGCGGFTAIGISRSSMVLMHLSLLRLLTYKECTFYKINKLCKQILRHHRCCDLYTTYRLFFMLRWNLQRWSLRRCGRVANCQTILYHQFLVIWMRIDGKNDDKPHGP